MSLALIWTLTSILFVIGLIGTLVPLLPGIALIYAGVLLHAFLTQFATISAFTVIALGALVVLATIVDYAGSIVGARYGGGKKWSLVGAVVGALFGAFTGPLGLFLGAFAGAFLGALIEGNAAKGALKIAAGSLLGALGAGVVQFGLGVALIAAFLLAVWQ